ncbi:voltage-gated potassium channel [Halohasta litchfieldiae]|jgi:voltage-gated potassium channel|uniref:Voltage-gated potassium channel n=1 Tax=Halohasta litchfieldiae TaxID=1073996 RepID=A0A1H6RTZ7_9EURY|nr:NAD-binding protein [Halohasta litchfieldiae]ATW89242.1 voltage-gated potassium channel [Halohasta litchfieldiae]SEI57916.1 voltage-gated potassium channel [Halohasta litchfieldiae]
MKWTHDWVSIRASILLTFAIAILSIIVGLVHISTGGVDSPLAFLVPDAVRRAVGFTGTLTGFTMLGSALALKQRYQIGWYATAILLPITAIQGLLQVSPFAVPLVALSVIAAPALLYNRKRFDRTFRPSPTQLAAGVALVTALSYGTFGSYALREEFDGIVTITDAFYYTIVTASTVGYGDVTAAPGSELGKLFSISVLLLNVAAFAVALGVLLTPAIEAQLSKALGRMTDSQFNLLDDHVMILGYGDLTEPIIENLATNSTQFAIITMNETAARRLSDRDIPVVTADPSDENPLQRAGIVDAKAAIVATENDAQDALAILTARQLNDDLQILAAAMQRENVAKLRHAGANRVISPSEIGGRLLANSATGKRDAEEASKQLLGEELGD